MDVFSAALDSGFAFLRDAAIAAAYELGVWDGSEADARGADARGADARGAGASRRMRALLAVLDAIGAFDGPPPPRPTRDLPRAGWGRLADVIRSDRPLALDPAHEHGYQQHLLTASAPAARELVARLPAWLGREPQSLIDLGGGAGAYTAAFLDAYPAARATIVDRADVIAIARDALARFGDRVRFVAGDAREVMGDGRGVVGDGRGVVGDGRGVVGDGRDLVGRHDAALLANVLHLHSPDACETLCAAAARMGELVVVKDLRPDTLQGRFFALGMAIYTDAGDVYSTDEIRRWLPELCSEHRLEAADEGFVLSALVRPAELADDVGAAIPTGFARVLARAINHERGATRVSGTANDSRDPHTPQVANRQYNVLPTAPGETHTADPAAAIVAHYTRTMPARRNEQLAMRIFHAPLDWTRLPRLSAAIDRLNVILDDAGVRDGVTGGANAANPPQMKHIERAPTLAALYERTYYGRLMPLLYGDVHLARDGEPHAIIDRYLVAPLIHELCHLGPERPPIDPPHLDECIGGWLAIHVHGAFGEDDAIYGAPWLAQVGQAIARTFGIRAVVRAHAGIEPLPAWFTREAEALGWHDWTQRRSLHLLADTMDPQPWVELARSRGVPDDPAFDRLVVRDALRAMCVMSERDGAGFRTRAEVPPGPVLVENGWMTTARRGDVDRVDPRYWVPIHGTHELRISTLDEIEPLAARLVP